MQHLPLHTQRIKTQSRNQMIDVTRHVQNILEQHAIAFGMVIVFVPHTTAAVTINEDADPDVKSDLLHKLSELIPKSETYYEHNEGNSDSHLKTSLVGNSVTVLIESGRLLLGQWQGIYFCEFDGPRTRSLQVKVIDYGRGENE